MKKYCNRYLKYILQNIKLIRGFDYTRLLKFSYKLTYLYITGRS